MIAITRHIFINILQTEHFPAVKFDKGYEKNMNFLVIPMIPKSLEFKTHTGTQNQNWVPLMREGISTSFITIFG